MSLATVQNVLLQSEAYSTHFSDMFCVTVKETYQKEAISSSSYVQFLQALNFGSLFFLIIILFVGTFQFEFGLLGPLIALLKSLGPLLYTSGGILMNALLKQM